MDDTSKQPLSKTDTVVSLRLLPKRLPARAMAAWAVASIGLLLTYLTYAPGLMPPDAQDQLRQAQTGHYVDWHPPIMAWIWSGTNKLIPGPEGFFLILIVLYWGGFFLLMRYASRLPGMRQLAISILPFMPFLFNFAGTIWKDVLVFGCCLSALGLILTQSPVRKETLLRTASVVVLLLIGCLARWNSVLAVVPIIVLLVWPKPPTRRPLFSTIRRIVICAPFVLVIWAASSQLINYQFLHAEKTGIVNSLFAWDLVGLSERTGHNLLPDTWSLSQNKKILNTCYSPQSHNDLLQGRCSFVAENLRQQGGWKASVLLPIWLKTIAEHPLSYFAIRLQFVHTLFWPNNIFVFDAASPSHQHRIQPNPMFEIMAAVLSYCRVAPGIHIIFTVGFWMLVSAGLCVLFAFAMTRRSPNYYLSLLLSVSAAAYVWPLVVIGVAGDLRYAYWTIAASCLAVLLGGAGATTASNKLRLQRADAKHFSMNSLALLSPSEWKKSRSS